MKTAAFTLIALQSAPKKIDWEQVSMFLILLILIVLAVLGGWWINKKWGKPSGETESSIELGRSRIILSGFVLAAFLLVVGAGWIIYRLVPQGSLPDQPEVLMGLVVVTAIAALMTLLFILAAGFSFMNLTDAKQPLGLPEGSIRAMIALILIMVFIIFGIYMFRVVGEGNYTQVEAGLPTDMAKYAGKTIFVEHDQEGKYSVWLQSKVSDDGARLAQQLLTTVGTLVVAVAGFYFGSTAVSSAVAAVQGTTPATSPTITDLSPKEGKNGETIDVGITGTDFKSPKTVQLARGPGESMAGSEILWNPTMIRCKFVIDKDPGGDKWDVVVENEDGKLARKEKIFTINPADQV